MPGLCSIVWSQEARREDTALLGTGRPYTKEQQSWACSVPSPNFIIIVTSLSGEIWIDKEWVWKHFSVVPSREGNLHDNVRAWNQGSSNFISNLHGEEQAIMSWSFSLPRKIEDAQSGTDLFLIVLWQPLQTQGSRGSQKWFWYADSRFFTGMLILILLPETL